MTGHVSLNLSRPDSIPEMAVCSPMANVDVEPAGHQMLTRSDGSSQSASPSVTSNAS